MTKETPLLRLFVKGGLISPADLLRVMKASGQAGNSFIMFGSRQDILFPVSRANRDTISTIVEETGLTFNFKEPGTLKDPAQHQNIVSSYVAANLLDTTWWLKEDIYHYILDGFDYQPMLKVNIIDPIQSLVPLFTGHLNFIASKEENYWYLFIRKEESNDMPGRWPDLIHGNDIALAARSIENVLLKSPALNVVQLYERVNNVLGIHSRQPEEDLRMPTALFPYYEGLNTMQNNLLWLGLYWRNNRFDIDFLSAACRLCQETNVGKISITPWKSFIIKGIRSGDRIHWEKLMGKYGINLRHSSLELNWHLPVMDNEALELKDYLVRQLDKQDISTHGLTFSIKTSASMLLFTSVVIEKSMNVSGSPSAGTAAGPIATNPTVTGSASKDTAPAARSGSERYNILYALDFNPNHSEYLVFAREVEKERLPSLLIKLSKLYFRELESDADDAADRAGDDEQFRHVSSYQCGNCLTIYDKKYGDPGAGIRPGTLFEELPEDYTCPLCLEPKEAFIPVADGYAAETGHVRTNRTIV